MSPQLQQVLAEIDRLSSTEQIQVIEYINTRQRSSVLETITNLQTFGSIPLFIRSREVNLMY
jgi:hypothetical protein